MRARPRSRPRARSDHGTHRHKGQGQRRSCRTAPAHRTPMTPPRHESWGPAEALRRRSRWWKANVVFGVLLLATLIVVLTYVAEAHRFVALLTHLTPAWLLVA